jgi:hypothetical protein
LASQLLSFAQLPSPVCGVHATALSAVSGRCARCLR